MEISRHEDGRIFIEEIGLVCEEDQAEELMGSLLNFFNETDRERDIKGAHQKAEKFLLEDIEKRANYPPDHCLLRIMVAEDFHLPERALPIPEDGPLTLTLKPSIDEGYPGLVHLGWEITDPEERIEKIEIRSGADSKIQEIRPGDGQYIEHKGAWYVRHMLSYVDHYGEEFKARIFFRSSVDPVNVKIFPLILRAEKLGKFIAVRT